MVNMSKNNPDFAGDPNDPNTITEAQYPLLLHELHINTEWCTLWWTNIAMENHNF